MDNNKIYNLKITHHYYDSGDNISNYPIDTSVELSNYYNDGFLEWKKIISHTYFDINDKKTITKEEKLNNVEIINEIENMNLKNLKNNYYTDQSPENYSSWEIEYNYKFKIVGTYDNEINEYNKIAELLDFFNIIKNERG